MNTPFDSAAKWLTPRRIRAHAIMLALCLWSVCAIDYATPGLFDRAGNIKFQDFLPFYISAQMIVQGHTADLYNQQTQAEQVQAIVGRPTSVRVPYLYGPQVALIFTPFMRFSFPTAARVWVALNLFLFAICIYLIWKRCPNLSPYPGTVALGAVAFPALFHFFVRGQNSVLLLACFAVAYLAFRIQREWLAGFVLGLLIFKPQLLVAVPFVLLLARAWKPLLALILSASAQLAFACVYFGASTMNSYFDLLLHPSHWLGTAELPLSAVQMHSLRAFSILLIPWPQAAFAFYAVTAVAAIILASRVWTRSPSLALRFSALSFAAVLVNPHLFIYDLLVLAPAILVLADWISINTQAVFRLLLYLSVILPLFGPLSRWTHLQLSVLAFAALLFCLWRNCTQPAATSSHKLAPTESRVV